jgi:hypothetical protein
MEAVLIYNYLRARVQSILTDIIFRITNAF